VTPASATSTLHRKTASGREQGVPAPADSWCSALPDGRAETANTPPSRLATQQTLAMSDIINKMLVDCAAVP
jgi:hypothetical protein